MIKHYYLSLLLVFGLFIAGCKNDPPDMSGATVSTDGYQPITKRSTWNYHKTYNDSRHPDQTETMVMDGSRTTINSRTYYSINDKVDTITKTSYFYQGNGEYHIRSLVIGDGNLVEYLYLKDNLSAGQTWTAPITDNGKLQGFKAQIVGKMIKPDTAMIVSSMSFKHVAHTQLQLQYDIGDGKGYTTYQLIDFYVAKGVGIIEMDTDAGQPANLKSSQLLISYKIEK